MTTGTAEVSQQQSEALGIQQKINQILWGKCIVEVVDSSDEIRPLILRSLTTHENNHLDFIYNRELREALEDGMLLSEELFDIYEEQELWNERDEILIRGMQKKISILKDQIHQFTYMKSRRKRAERDLKRTKEELEEKLSYRNQLCMLSAENRAEEIKRRFMMMMSAEDIDGNKYWEDKEKFLNEIDLLLIYNLALAYYEKNVFNEAETREIARSGAWRFRWQAAKKGADLFGKSIASWSEMQSAVVYWSQFYDFVYESTERPSDVVIADDSACDKWYEQQVKKLSLKQTQTSGKNALGTKKSKTNKFHQEQFLFVDPNDPEAVKKIQDMNTPSARIKLQIERKKIEEAAKKGRRVKEWDLRKRDYLVGDLKEFVTVKKTGPGANKK